MELFCSPHPISASLSSYEFLPTPPAPILPPRQSSSPPPSPAPTMPLQLGDEGEEMHSQLARQTAMDSALCSLMLDIKAVRGAADRKVERLRAVLREDESRALTHFAEVSASELGFNPTVSFLLVIVFPGALSPVYSRHLHTPMLTTCDCLQKCENAHTYAEDHQHSALTRQIGYDSFELSLHDLLPDGTGIFYQQSDLSNFRGADTVLCDSWSTHNSYTLLYTVLLQFSLPFCLSFSPLLCAPAPSPSPEPPRARAGRSTRPVVRLQERPAPPQAHLPESTPSQRQVC